MSSGPPSDATDEAPQSIDELLVLGGGYGRYQWQQSVLNCGCFAVCGATLLLPNLLFPRLREAWPELTPADEASVNSVFFVGNLVGLFVWGSFGDAPGDSVASAARVSHSTVESLTSQLYFVCT